MKKFRVKNLTVAVGAKDQLKACGVNFSCPGGAGSVICGITNGCFYPSNGCQRFTVGCFTGTVQCGAATIACPANSIGCFISNDGCGQNFSTLPPTDFTFLVNELDEVTDKLDLIDVMKEDLNTALKNLNGVEQELSDVAKPQTLEEAKEVEANLEGALKEVKGLIKGLK